MHPWGSHVRLTHIFDNPIENVRECWKCDAVEHANPTLEAKGSLPDHSGVLERLNTADTMYATVACNIYMYATYLVYLNKWNG